MSAARTTSAVTWLPMPHASQRRVVARADEAPTFRLAIGVYAAFGTGPLGVAAWLAREGLRTERG